MPASSVDAGLRLAKLCRALGHPARIIILRFLTAQRGGATCGEIVRQLPLAQSTVSQHLAVLKDAGLVRADADPPRVRYAVEPLALDALKRDVASL